MYALTILKPVAVDLHLNIKHVKSVSIELKHLLVNSLFFICRSRPNVKGLFVVALDSALPVRNTQKYLSYNDS